MDYRGFHKGGPVPHWQPNFSTQRSPSNQSAPGIPSRSSITEWGNEGNTGYSFEENPSFTNQPFTPLRRNQFRDMAGLNNLSRVGHPIMDTNGNNATYENHTIASPSSNSPFQQDPRVYELAQSPNQSTDSYNDDCSPNTDKTFRMEDQDGEEEDDSDDEQDNDHETDEEDVETGTKIPAKPSLPKQSPSAFICPKTIGSYEDLKEKHWFYVLEKKREAMAKVYGDTDQGRADKEAEKKKFNEKFVTMIKQGFSALHNLEDTTDKIPKRSSLVMQV
jgi:hypothetical protein